MSSVYVTEPPTRGKLLLHTSVGDVDVELWPKEAPLACRNFVQLAMEGYYNGVIFHRIIKNLFVQTGDPTGTGQGGESSFGAPFPDELHSRLKFSHRGIVAMANDNVPSTNRSQFFITLEKASWLDKKHTIFGKVTGNTIFNVLRMGEQAETDAKTDRPVDPPRIISIEVLENPFDDIVPRHVAAAERKPAATGRAAAGAARKPAGTKPAANLLSFGDDGEEDEQGGSRGRKPLPAAAPAQRPRVMVALDAAETAEEDRVLLQAQQRERDRAAASTSSSLGKASREPEGATGAPPSSSPATHAASTPEPDADDFAASMRAAVRQKRPRLEAGGPATAAASCVGRSAGEAMDAPAAPAPESTEFNRLRDELRSMRTGGSSRAVPVRTGAALAAADAAAAEASLLTPLQQLRAKFKTRAKSTGARESSTLEKLAAFTSTMRAASSAAGSGDGGAAPPQPEAPTYSGQVLEEDVEAAGDGGAGGEGQWMAHRLKFKKHIDDQFRDGLVTIDDSAGGAGGEGRKGRK